MTISPITIATILAWTIVMVIVMLVKKVVKLALILLVVGYGIVLGCNWMIAHHYMSANVIPISLTVHIPTQHAGGIDL